MVNSALETESCCDFLVLLFCGTLGNNSSELLGSDESDVIILVWQLLDLVENQAGDIHYIYIRPESEFDLSSEWVKETDITLDLLQSAIPLKDAIEQFEQTLRNELNGKGRTSSFFVCTDGQCHLRQVLHPAAVRTNTVLPDFFYSFFDLKKEFLKCFPLDHICYNSNMSNMSVAPSYEFPNVTVQEMLHYLQLSVTKAYTTLGVDHVMRMGTVVQAMISEKYNYKLLYPEAIAERLETGPCEIAEIVPDECIVRARGLPWQASDHDIARFFKGLNIARGGVALVLNPQGRRNGEALVRFVSCEHRDLALLRHKHHMENRYIEVYKAKGEEFMKVATGNSCEAMQFLSNGGDAIVRVRGLPFSATASDIINFFGDEIQVANGEDGVLFVKYADGRATGDAFVLFESEEMAHLALQKHKQTLGKRYIEIFKSTGAEVQQVLSRHITTPLIQKMSSSAHMAMYLPGSLHPTQAPLVAAAAASQAQNQAAISPGSIRNCVRLRGMPYSATVEDILQFLGDLRYGILPNGIHMVLNQQGRPSGDAFIQMNNPEKAAQAALDISKGGCHKKHMRERYVEVFQCSGDEMNMVLMGGTLNRNGIQPPPGMGLLLPDQMAVPRQETVPPSFPTAYTIPSHPVMLQAHPQIPLEVLQPQALFPPVAGHRPIYAHSALLPCAATYFPTPPVSPNITPQANAVQALTPAAAGLPPHLAVAQAAPLPVGLQLRTQGISYNAGMSDILALIKQQQQQQQQAQFYASSTTIETQSPLDEKVPASQVTGSQPYQSEWACLV